jgi:hypothetical protein
MPRLTLITFTLLTLCNSYAQIADRSPDSLNTTYQRFDASYVFGGQVYNNNFIYNPGFSFQSTYGIQLNESVAVGLGTGYTFLKDEHFMPFFIEASGSRKNKYGSPTVTMQFGYAHGWYTGDIPNVNYDFRGGFFIDAGLGRKIPINRGYSFYFHWSYRHQFARMSYEVFGGQEFTESLNYDMLVISLGLIRHVK